MKHCLLPIFMLSVGYVCAQERTTGSGGEAASSGGTVSYSIGLIDYSNQSSSLGNLTGGVQQPYELFALSVDEWDMNWDLSVFPNPTSNLLFIESETSIDGLTYAIMDVSGKLIQQGVLAETKNSVDISSLAIANYLLQIRVDGTNVRTYQITKN
jgi:hypothetical protein